MNPDRQVFLASAGTGKTFKLAGRFLALLFQGVEPRKILATTFTRKAAGEILERVLSWLAKATQDEKELKDLRGELPSDLAKEATAERCLELLAKLSGCLDEFNVRTMDSFFVETAKVFALDLDIPPGWRILEDEEDARMRAETLGALFSSGDPRDTLEMLRALKQKDPSSMVLRSTLQSVQEGLDLFQGSRPEAWDQIHAEGGILPDAAILPYADMVKGLSPILTGKGKPIAAEPKLREQLPLWISESRWRDVIQHTAVRNVLAGNPTYYTKLPEDWQAWLTTVGQHARAQVLKEVQLRNQGLFDFLRRFDLRYQAAKRRRRGFVFQDFPLALRSMKQPMEKADHFHRLGRQVEHLLLDEFQDTSVIQWQVLEPLMKHALDSRRGVRSFFCVGDVKQAIYAWRHGEARLLEGLQTWFDLPARSLNKSWRSSPVVLNAVNDVFQNLAENAVIQDADEPLQQAAQEFQAAFPEHEAEHQNMPGQFTLLQAKPAKSAPGKAAAALNLAAERVRILHDQCPHATIGVLFRSNAKIGAFLQILLQDNLPASGEGGNALTDSEAVLAVLALLHLADHPTDSVAAFHVEKSFLAKKIKPKEKWTETAHSIRATLLEQGFGHWLENIASMPAAKELDPWDHQRLGQLADLGHIFDLRAGLRVSEFLDFARSKKIEALSASPIRVMTIHKSKGLEFDAVVLPELHANIPGRGNPLLLDRPDPRQEPTTITIMPQKDLTSSHAELARLVDQDKATRTREFFCVLYVAMTRAKRCLEIIVPGLVADSKNKVDAGKRLSALLRASFQVDPVFSDTTLKQNLSDNELRWDHGIEKEAGPPARKKRKLQLGNSQGNRNLPHLAPSTLQAQATTVAQFFSTSGQSARSHGTLVHKLFETVHWLEDGVSSDEALLETLGPETPGAMDAIQVFHTALDSPQIRKALSRSEWPEEDGWEAHNEWNFRFLDATEEGPALLTGSIDRLLLRKVDGKPVAARIFDFKTDRLDAESSTTARTLHHASQMAAYQRAIVGLIGIPVDQVVTKLLFTQTEVITESR